jgi:hypothetical protein
MEVASVGDLTEAERIELQEHALELAAQRHINEGQRDVLLDAAAAIGANDPKAKYLRQHAEPVTFPELAQQDFVNELLRERSKLLDNSKRRKRTEQELQELANIHKLVTEGKKWREIDQRHLGRTARCGP